LELDVGVNIGVISAIVRTLLESELGRLILTLIGIAIEMGVISGSIFWVFKYFQTEHYRSITNLKSSLMGKILLYGAAVTTILVLATLIHSLFSFMPPLVVDNTANEWYNEGIHLGQLGKYAEAIKAYDETLKINPEDYEAWNNKGFALVKVKRYEEAIKAYDEALKINPQVAEAWYGKGATLDNLKRYEEAIKAYDEGLKINPQDANAWIMKGFALDNLKRYEEAIKAYDEGLKINPQDAGAWYGKGFALEKLGRNDEAKRAFDEAATMEKASEGNNI